MNAARIHSCSSWNSRTSMYDGARRGSGFRDSLGAPRGRWARARRAARATMHERTSLASCSFRNTNDFSRKRTLEIEFPEHDRVRAQHGSQSTINYVTAGTRAQSPLHDESCSRDPENWSVPGLVHSAVHRTSPHITAHRSQSPQTMRACRSSTPRRSTLGAQAHTQRWPLKTHVLPSSKRDGPQTSIPSNMMQAQPRCSSSPLSAARIVMTA